MQIRYLAKYGIGFILAMVCSCVIPYEPEVINTDNQFLVVTGLINSGDGPTTIVLSRTQNLADSNPTQFVSNAQVAVEAENNGQSFTLAPGSNGTYSAPKLNLNETLRYRLRIRTADGKDYASAFVPVKKTPKIDSISWKAENTGLRIYANTHDPLDKTRYYRWSFEETWEFYSFYRSNLEYKNKQFFYRSENINHCWASNASTDIKTSSTVNLKQDVVAEFPLTFIPANDTRLRYKYSILVKQSALSPEAYAYWETVKKNTENIGSLFDPQPSQFTGNITCLNAPDEIVVGFIDISSIEEKRIFIDRASLPRQWRTFITGYEGCKLDTVKQQPMQRDFNLEEAADQAFGTGRNIPVNEYTAGSTIIGYVYSSAECIDCRKRGTNVKPSYWP